MAQIFTRLCLSVWWMSIWSICMVQSQSSPAFGETILDDTFDDGIVSPLYVPLGGVSISESNGSMDVSIFQDGDGFEVDFSEGPDPACITLLIPASRMVGAGSQV